VLETEILNNYYELFILVKDKDIRLEEYARNQIVAETAHQDAVNKMLRKPNQIESFVSEGQMIK
jgi:bacterioferritin